MGRTKKNKKKQEETKDIDKPDGEALIKEIVEESKIEETKELSQKDSNVGGSIDNDQPEQASK